MIQLIYLSPTHKLLKYVLTSRSISSIGITAETTPTDKERNGVKVVLHNVTIEDVHSPEDSPSMLCLSHLQQVEFTDVHIRNNEMGALALYDTLASFQGNNTFRL